MAKPYVCCRTVSADYLGDDEHLVNQQAQENRMLTPKEIECLRASQFRRHFPVLAAMLRFHELSTPLTQQHYVRAQDGATYGIEMSTQRLSSAVLDVRTPVPGLLVGRAGCVRCRHPGRVHERPDGSGRDRTGRCCDSWAGDPRVLAVTPRLAVTVSNGSKIEMQSCR